MTRIVSALMIGGGEKDGKRNGGDLNDEGDGEALGCKSDTVLGSREYH